MHVGTIIMLILGGVLSTFMCIFPLYKVVRRLIRKDFRTDENFEKADKTFILYIGILACFVAGYFYFVLCGQTGGISELYSLW